MKISDKNSYLRSNWDNVIDHMRNGMGDNNPLDKEGIVRDGVIKELENVKDIYYVTTKASLIAVNIDLKNSKYDILKSMPIMDTASAIYNEDKEDEANMFRYDGKILHMSAIALDKFEDDGRPARRVKYTYYKVDLYNNNFHQGETSQVGEKKYFDNVLMKLLVYMFLSDIDIQVLPINGNNGLSRAEGKVKNETSTPIKLVTEKWNTLTIRVGDFGVCGHMRLQPCGPNREQRKLIYIAPFLKHSYTRHARQ